MFLYLNLYQDNLFYKIRYTFIYNLLIYTIYKIILKYEKGNFKTINISEDKYVLELFY